MLPLTLMMTMNQSFPQEETHFSHYCCFYATPDCIAEAPEDAYARVLPIFSMMESEEHSCRQREWGFLPGMVLEPPT